MKTGRARIGKTKRGKGLRPGRCRQSWAGRLKVGRDPVALGLLIENVRDYAIFALDPAGRVTDWNLGAELVTGYSADEIFGKQISTFHTPEDIQNGRPDQLLRLAAASGRTEEEGLRVRKDGSRFSAAVVLNAISDKRGNLVGFVNFTRDISDLMHVQQQLRESEERFRLFSQNFPGLTWIADSEGRYRFVNWNFERSCRPSPHQWIGKTPDELFTASTAQTVKQSNAQVLSTGAPIQVTEEIAEAGTPRYFLVSKFPMSIGDETFIGGISIDITPRIVAEQGARRVRDEELRQERVRSIAHLSSEFAHKLNNTLNALSLRLSLIKNDPVTSQVANIDDLIRRVFDAAESVARLQDFARTHREPLPEG